MERDLKAGTEQTNKKGTEFDWKQLLTLKPLVILPEFYPLLQSLFC